jgi:hypothetical protein
MIKTRMNLKTLVKRLFQISNIYIVNFFSTFNNLYYFIEFWMN